MKKYSLLAVSIIFWCISNAQLTIYSSLNFQGTSSSCVIRTIYKGSAIPNGLNNSIKSIQLSQGFMATLAENEDGTGERFTYMATQSAINVNLAFVMQNKVSFIRVLRLPNTPVRKKGAGVITNADEIAANVTWFYDWGIRDTTTDTREFVPMAWGSGGAADLRVDSVINKDSLTHYLAFNEPNHTSQANMFVNRALPLYKNMLRAGYRMGSPVGTEEAYATWVDSFTTEANKQKLQIDFVCVHWYDWGNWLSTLNANPTATQVLNRFKAYIDNVWNLYKKPIWITEFNANVNRSAAVNQAFFELAIPWMDSDPRIERYAPFFEDHFPLLDINGNLTPMGTMYNAQTSALAYPQNIVDARPVYPETILAAWNTSALTTTTSSSPTSSFAPTTLNANLTAPLAFTAGSGVTGPFAAAGYWGGLSWSNATSATDGITNNKFFSFSLKSNAGKTVNYTLIDTIHIRVNTSGPTNYLLQYQINSGSFTNITTWTIPTVNALTFTSLNPVSLTGITALQNLPSTSTVTFRLVPFKATSTNSFAIGNGTTEIDNDFTVLGSFVEDSINLITTPGNALNFDGVNDYVTIADANNLDLVNNYSLEAWIRPTGFSSLGGIISKSQTNTSTGYFLSLSNTSPFTGLNFDGLQTANGILEAGKWYHIAAVKNGSTRTLYVNGIATTLTGTTITTAANTQALTIGVHNLQTPKYFTGSIDEVRVWNVALEEAQLKENMFNTISPTLNNLVDYFNFDNGIAGGTNTGLNILRDQTAGTNNGTLTNFATLTGNTSNWVESYAMVMPETIAETNQTATSFTANWLAPSIATLGTVNNYLLDVSSNANFSTFVNGFNGLSVSTTTQNVTGLAPNTIYYYRVRANKSTLSNHGGFSQTIMVNPLSNNADLSALLLNTGSLSPSFSAAQLTYNVTYANNTNSITVTPTKSNANATIQVNINGGSYATVTSGLASGALSLNVGTNTINILVTAEDLVTTKTYVITAIREVNTWTGASSANYNTAANWTGNAVPTINDDVLIPDVSSGSNRFPQITGANHPQFLSFARNITINSGASLIITNNAGFTTYGHLQVSGNIINNGTIAVTSLASNGVTIEFNGTSAQTIAANTFSGNAIYNLIINNAAGVTLNGALTVNGRLTPTLGTFTTNNHLTLSSIATRTASVGSGTGIITGNVTVQRFIPSGRRGFRFLAHPFTSNLAMSSLTDDIDITGAGGAPFTTTTSNSPSAFTYNNATANVTITPTDPGWTALTASSTLNTKTGYRILVRGTKGQTNSLTGGAYTPAAVTLDWTGVLNQGNQVFTLNRANANAQYNLVGNPYASPVDLSLTQRGSSINANFTVWNAQGGTRGTYVTQAFSTPYILPSGAAFFAQTADGAINNTITFEEADKVTSTPTSIFRTSNIEDQLVLELKDSNNNYADQLTFFFDDKNKNYTANNDVLWDAEKLTNPDANLYSFSNDGKKLAIDRRPLADSTIIPLGLTNTANASFTLTVKELPQINNSYNLYLNDKWLNTQTLLQANTTINIEVNSNAQSQGSNRFEIVSQLKPALPTVSNTFNIKLSPNPTRDLVIISFSNVEQANTTIILTNAIGKTVKTIQVGVVQTGVQTVNVKDLAKGIYYVTLSNGTNKKTEKLVIQ